MGMEEVGNTHPTPPFVGVEWDYAMSKKVYFALEFTMLSQGKSKQYPELNYLQLLHSQKCWNTTLS